MKKLSSTLLVIVACFISLLFNGCTNYQYLEECTITYYDPHNSIYYYSSNFIRVYKGQTCPEPSHSRNHFLYWSESKASQAEAKEFNFKKPIKTDTNLYAIYTPELVNSEVVTSPCNTITSTTIDIAMYTRHVPLLDDGTYAGLKLSHSVDNKNWEDIPLLKPTSYTDQYNIFKTPYRVYTYTFDTPLTEGKHYFIVTNGFETYSKTFTCINPEEYRTVKFIANGNLLAEYQVYGGQNLSPEYIPADPNYSYNHFLYWSKSRESIDKAVKFDFNNEQITEDMTLYAIYTPKFYYPNAITTLTPNKIEIKLESINVYPLEDGSYAGIELYISNTNYHEYLYHDNLKLPKSYRDEDYYRYLTYSIPVDLNYDEYYFKISNDHESNHMYITFTDPKELQSVSFIDNGNTIKIIEVNRYLDRDDMPSPYAKKYNTFLYWSKSQPPVKRVVCS